MSLKLRYGIILALLILLLGGGTWFVLFFYINSGTSINQKKAEVKIAEVATVLDPVGLFWQKFSTGDYKVTVKHVRLVDTSPIWPLPVFDGGVFYYEKGELVRLEMDENNKAYYIFKDSKLFRVSDNDKTFTIEDATEGQKGKVTIDSLKEMSVTLPFITKVRADSFTWKPIDTEEAVSMGGADVLGDGYIAEQKWSMDSTHSFTVRILLAPVTKLITSILFSSVDEGVSQQTRVDQLEFTYESVPNISELKKFPFDYKKLNTNIYADGGIPSGISVIDESMIPSGYVATDAGGVMNPDAYATPSPGLFPSTQKDNSVVYVRQFTTIIEQASLNIIAEMYYEGEKCSPLSPDSGSNKSSLAACVLGECIKTVQRSPVSDGVTNFYSKHVSYKINDRGSCAHISFSANNEKDALPEDQMLKVVNSLKRVP